MSAGYGVGMESTLRLGGDRKKDSPHSHTHFALHILTPHVEGNRADRKAPSPHQKVRVGGLGVSQKMRYYGVSQDIQYDEVTCVACVCNDPLIGTRD